MLGKFLRICVKGYIGHGVLGLTRDETA